MENLKLQIEKKPLESGFAGSWYNYVCVKEDGTKVFETGWYLDYHDAEKKYDMMLHPENYPVEEKETQSFAEKYCFERKPEVYREAFDGSIYAYRNFHL